MKQPSKNDLFNDWAKTGEPVTIIEYILDRYYLIDKTEPVSGVPYLENEALKGTVARLEVDIEMMDVEISKNETTITKFQAEVDRLNGDNKKMARLLEVYGMTIDEQKAEIEQLKKPEAVGCGRQWNPTGNSLMTCGCTYHGVMHLCPDCQAKAKPIEQVGRAYKRVELPIVPNSESNASSLSTWTTMAELFMQAVKDRLEAMP
jgi:hypothetical protein